MCLICTDWIKGSLTTNEALKNLGEMVEFYQTEEEFEHYYEILDKLNKGRNEVKK